MDPDFPHNIGMIQQNEQLMCTVESLSPSRTFHDISYPAPNKNELTPSYTPNLSESNSPKFFYDLQEESNVYMQHQTGSSFVTSQRAWITEQGGLSHEQLENQTPSQHVELPPVEIKNMYHFEQPTYFSECYSHTETGGPHQQHELIIDNHQNMYSHIDSVGSDDSVELPPVEIKNIYNFEQPTYKKYLKDFPNDNNLLPAFSVFAETKKPINRRGRPVTYNKPGHNFSESDSEDERLTVQSRGCKRGAKNILLWKFILGELRNPGSNHVKWEDERQGIFKFVDTAECSRLWGMMKKKETKGTKEDMTFEKLSRGIRYYYKDGLMSRSNNIRLVYKFNWDRVPKSHWPKFLH